MPSSNGKVIRWRAMDRNVLLVGVWQPAQSVWIARIGAVEGKNHQNEASGVAKSGTPVLREEAVCLLGGLLAVVNVETPAASGCYRWRD